MLRTTLAAAAVLVTLAAAVPAAAQSADKIVGRYAKVHARGAVARVTSTLAEGVAIGPDGARGRFVLRSARPDRLRLDVELAGVTTTECYNGKSAWRSDARGLRTLVGPDAHALRLDAILVASRFRDLGKQRVAGGRGTPVTVDGAAGVAVDFRLSGARERVVFDARSGLPLLAERRIEGALDEVRFGDYRAVDGVLEPHAIRLRRAGAEIALTVGRLEHNRGVDETAFRLPGPADAPDLAALMQAIRANQAKVQDRFERYGFRETRTERETDANGVVKVRETRVFEVTPVAGRVVKRLVEVDGRELAGAEAEKARKQALEDTQTALAEREEREKKKREGKLKEEEDGITILTFLDACEVTSVRREGFRGQTVLVFDFEPRAGFKPKSLGERIVGQLAGTMWIDEKALQIARLEARLVNSVKVGGGLVGSLQPSTAIVFEQAKVDGEVWLPSYAEVNLSARVFLFAKVAQNTVARYTDYKRFDVDSEYEIE